MNKTWGAIIAILVFSSICHAKNYGNFNNVEYVRCYDGDTCTFNIPGEHPVIGERISVRINGIDTPEIRGKCDKEKELAKKAKKVVNDLLSEAGSISLLNIGRGKYFRLVANIRIQAKEETAGYDPLWSVVNIADELLYKGLAVKYDGGTKTKDWCE